MSTTDLKVTVTPTGGNPIDLVPRGCFTDGAIEYEIAAVYGAIVLSAGTDGDADLANIFRPIPDEVLAILERSLAGQIDRTTLSRSNDEDLLRLLAVVFNIDKQHHAQQIRELLVEVGLL